MQHRYMFMKKIGILRLRISGILNEILGSEDDNIFFYPEDIIKKPGGSKKKSKYELATSSNWSAYSMISPRLNVSCVGLTMQEFIVGYEKQNIVYRKSENLITLYKNEPIWKTKGYVIKVDENKDNITLEISDILNPVCISTLSETPKWLYNSNSRINFKCKIYQFWRFLNISKIEKSDWSKVWKTFRRDNQ